MFEKKEQNRCDNERFNFQLYLNSSYKHLGDIALIYHAERQSKRVTSTDNTLCVTKVRAPNSQPRQGGSGALTLVTQIKLMT